MDLFISRRTNDVPLLSLLLTLLVVASVVVLGNRFIQPISQMNSHHDAAADYPIYLNGHQVAIDTGRRTRYLEDPDGLFTPGAVFDLPLRHWSAILSDNIALQTESDTVWYRIPLENETRQTLSQRVEVRWPNLLQVDFYLQRSRSTLLHAERGLLETPEPKPTVSSYPSFGSIRVPLESAKIDRSGSIENVYIVARQEQRIIFYEDVEEGFEIAKLNSQGVIDEYGANQFTIQYVINQLRARNS